MPGSFDNMGVWITAEDDDFPSASGWLNRLATSVSDALKRQYDVNTAPTDNAVAALYGTPGSATRAAARTDEFDSRLDYVDNTLKPLVFDTANKLAGDVGRTPFTPAWTNMPLGTGFAVLFAEYSVTKGRCHGTVLIRLGTGRPTTTTYMQWPVPPATALLDSFLPVGEAIFVDVSASVRQPGVIYMGNQTNGMRIALVNTAGTYEAFTDLNATVPFTWAANDTIALDFDYPVA
jgi:hypothetical protein